MHQQVAFLLKQMGMSVSADYLRLRLESHPDYPSLVAIQDTLEELGIESYACSGSKEELRIENKPFLAHFNSGGGDIQYFKDITVAEKMVKDFDKHWSGNIMFAETAKTYGNTAHDKQHKREKLNNRFGIAALLLSFTILAGLAIIQGTLASILLTVLSCIGLYFSWLIAQKEFGISNSVSDKICSMAKHSRCESVLFSKGAKLFSWLTWGDVGIVYFASSLIYVFISLLIGQTVELNFYFLLSLAGIIFPLYSVYYQWKVVKQWCMLCLGVVFVLMLNAVLGAMMLPSMEFGEVRRLAIGALLFGAALTVVLCVWQLLKSGYQKQVSSLENEIKATRLKRNPDIFNALLHQQEINPINLPEADEAIRFGNPEAPYQLVIACNPYCGPCAKAHQAVEELYEKYPDRLSVTVRFALYNNDDKNGKIVAAKEILKVAKVNPYKAIKDWYHIYDLEKFKQLHNTNGMDVNSTVEKYIIWNEKADIKGTPTFFINGRQLPELYNWVDFIEIIKFDMKD